MTTMQSAEVIFCNSCEKATYPSALRWHAQNPCGVVLAGGDCMEFEADNLFCKCEVAA
jgi:hypothetical protein